MRGGTVIGTCTCGRETRGFHDTKKSARTELLQHAAAAAKAGTDQLIEGNRCPHPEKSRYLTRESAEKHLGRVWRRARSGQLPARSYLCRCGFWHLTSKPITTKGN